MSFMIREMSIADYEPAHALWKNCVGIGLSSADEKEALAGFLNRNYGLCFVAWEGETLVGTVLMGNDGRRGYLYHLAVHPEFRRRGLGKLLVEKSLSALAGQGIEKSHIFVYADNEAGIQFWSQAGWKKRPELIIMSHDL